MTPPPRSAPPLLLRSVFLKISLILFVLSALPSGFLLLRRPLARPEAGRIGRQGRIDRPPRHLREVRGRARVAAVQVRLLLKHSPEPRVVELDVEHYKKFYNGPDLVYVHLRSGTRQGPGTGPGPGTRT